MRGLSSKSLACIANFNPKLVVEQALKPLLTRSLHKVLHMRHGAILGVGEILIGLSGNCSINHNEIEKAKLTLSKKERQIIADSENKRKF